MPRKGVIGVFSRTGERDDPSALLAQDALHGLRCAAGAQHERLFARPDAAVAPQKPRKTVKIRIITEQRPVRAAHKGVDVAELLRRFGQLRAVGHDGTLIGDRHIERVEATGAQEGVQRVRRDLEQLVGVVRQLCVDLRRIAVAKVLAEQTAAHHTTSV